MSNFCWLLLVTHFLSSRFRTATDFLSAARYLRGEVMISRPSLMRCVTRPSGSICPGKPTFARAMRHAPLWVHMSGERERDPSQHCDRGPLPTPHHSGRCPSSVDGHSHANQKRTLLANDSTRLDSTRLDSTRLDSNYIYIYSSRLELYMRRRVEIRLALPH